MLSHMIDKRHGKLRGKLNQKTFIGRVGFADGTVIDIGRQHSNIPAVVVVGLCRRNTSSVAGNLSYNEAIQYGGAGKAENVGRLSPEE